MMGNKQKEMKNKMKVSLSAVADNAIYDVKTKLRNICSTTTECKYAVINCNISTVAIGP